MAGSPHPHAMQCRPWPTPRGAAGVPGNGGESCEGTPPPEVGAPGAVEASGSAPAGTARRVSAPPCDTDDGVVAVAARGEPGGEENGEAGRRECDASPPRTRSTCPAPANAFTRKCERAAAVVLAAARRAGRVTRHDASREVAPARGFGGFGGIALARVGCVRLPRKCQENGYGATDRGG